MSHLIFTYMEDPENPQSAVEEKTLADAKAEAARNVDAICQFLLHTGCKIEVLVMSTDDGEATFIFAVTPEGDAINFSVERKVGVLA